MFWFILFEISTWEKGLLGRPGNYLQGSERLILIVSHRSTWKHQHQKRQVQQQQQQCLHKWWAYNAIRLIRIIRIAKYHALDVGFPKCERLLKCSIISKLTANKNKPYVSQRSQPFSNNFKTIYKICPLFIDCNIFFSERGRW